MRPRSPQVTKPSADGATTVDAGPLGGVMRCGNLPAANGRTVVCIWADGNTVGVLNTITDTDTAAFAKTVLAFRNAAEH